MAWLAHHSAAGSPARQAFIIICPIEFQFAIILRTEPAAARKRSANQNGMQNGPEIRNFKLSEIRRETR
jgi:hypothetical protein